MSFLPVLLAVALTLGLIWARSEFALVHGWGGGVLVIRVTVTLFFRWPSIFVVLASHFAALPWPGVSLFMFTERLSASTPKKRGGGKEDVREITWPLEELVTFAAFLGHLDWGRFAATSH